MKILFIKPWPDSFNWYHSHMLGLAYLAGYMRERGHQVEIVDASFLRLDEIGLKQILRHKKAEIVGITSMTHEIPRARRIARYMKSISPHVPIVLGGPHATARPVETLEEMPYLDFAVSGEGERPLELLCERLDSGRRDFENIRGLAFRLKWEIAFGGPQQEYVDLSSLPQPAVDLYYSKGWFKENPRSEYRIFASRGCPFQCAYCMRVLGSKVRWRNPEDVIQEWDTAVRYYNANVVFFHDEIFLYDNPHTHRILDGIIPTGIHRKAVFNAMTHVKLVDDDILEKARRANCYKICIGIESGNNDILKRVHRNYTIEEADAAVQRIKRHNIRPFAFFILGHPGETHKTIRDTIYAAIKINPFEIGMGIMVPYPGTEIYHLAKSNQGGYKLLNTDWDAFDRYGGRALAFDNFTSRQLLVYQIIGYLLFFALNGKIKGMFDYMFPKLKAIKHLVLNRQL
jgi:anaerobic magnesium-protoporphyrin IX monomethyl ester cyclase